MKYNIVKYITNTAGQYSASVSATFDSLEKALVNYHQSLASLHNASDTLRAVVKVEDEDGNGVIGCREIVDHSVTEES